MLNYPEGTQTNTTFQPHKPFVSNHLHYGDYYGDSRLSKRLLGLISRVTLCQKVVINQLSNKLAEREAWYRLLRNKKLIVSKMLRELVNRTTTTQPRDHILLIEDTTNVHYNHLEGKLKDPTGLGQTYREGCFGYFLHTCMAIDALSSFPVGIPHAQMWHLDKDYAGYDELEGESMPIEDKSSFRWMDSILSSKEALKFAKRTTVVADRESDIYEVISSFYQQGIDFIIRSKHDRAIAESSDKLKAYTATLPLGGTHEVAIRSDSRVGRKARIAKLEIRFGLVNVQRVYKASSTGIKNYPKQVPLYVVEAKEIGQSDKPIYWILITSHQVESIQEALQILDWYKQRWHIEQLFRLMKNKGLGLEQLDLEYGQSFLKMGVVAIEAAFRIMQLNLAQENEPEEPIEVVFSKSEVLLLQILCKKYEGRTLKQKNHYKETSLAWAAWVIARIGGWKGYVSQNKPGPITFKIGWTKFNQMFLGFELFNSR